MVNQRPEQVKVKHRRKQSDQQGGIEKCFNPGRERRQKGDEGHHNSLGKKYRQSDDDHSAKTRLKNGRILDPQPFRLMIWRRFGSKEFAFFGALHGYPPPSKSGHVFSYSSPLNSWLQFSVASFSGRCRIFKSP